MSVALRLVLIVEEMAGLGVVVLVAVLEEERVMVRLTSRVVRSQASVVDCFVLGPRRGHVWRPSARSSEVQRECARLDDLERRGGTC